MANETEILQFIRENFSEDSYSVDNFKPKELIWVYIRCIEEKNRQIQLEVQKDRIGISNVEIEQTHADFSLPDMIFRDIDQAKSFLLKIKEVRRWPANPQ